jgi:serine/threonine protein kinase
MVGTLLNHYRITRVIGSGGMGEVYAAEDTKLHRHVAVKVLPAVVANDPERRQRLEREAHAIAALNHPNIVTIYSIEQVDGHLFLTMELVQGRPLSQLIRARGLSLEQLLNLAIPLADAVSAAHQQGIVHRDLKPDNIMVTDDGRPKVLDFGIARLADVAAVADADTTVATSRLTGDMRVIGTIAYMSPEQAEGRSVDQRSDIFSLGIVLYEMATGERPFKGDTAVSMLSSIVKDTAPAITTLNPALPGELARIVRRSLAKETAPAIKRLWTFETTCWN